MAQNLEAILGASEHAHAWPPRRAEHTGAVVWLTGLSAAGKSTLATLLCAQLRSLGYASYVLDGDILRRSLNADLDFSPQARAENVRRVAAVAALFADAGLLCIAACIAPYRADRALARRAASPHAFHEVYVAASLASCEARDPRGLYRRARAGTLRGFTGIDAPYEAPGAPDLKLQTDAEPAQDSLAKLLQYVLALHPLVLA